MAKKTKRPNLIEAIEGPFRPWFSGESWSGWKSVLRGISALPMSDADIEFFKSVTVIGNPRRSDRAGPG